MKKIKDLGIKMYKHPLFSGSFVMVIGSTAISAISYFYHLIMGRMLGPSSYGVLASIYSVLYLVSILPSSASFAIVKFISTAKDKSEVSVIYKGLEKFVLKFSLILCGLLIIASFPITNFLKIDNVWFVLMVVPVSFFVLMTLIIQSTLQGLLNFWGVVGPNLVSNIVKIILSALFVYLGFSIGGAMVAIIFGGFLAYLYARYLARGIKVSKKIKKDFNINPFYKYSLPVLLQSLALTSFITTDLVMVKHYFTSYDAGIYAALSNLGKIIFFASQPITHVMFPIVSKKHSKKEKYLTIFFLSLFVVSGISSIIVLFYYLFPEFAINLLYGKEYLIASSNLFLMGLVALVYTLSHLIINFFLSIGNTKIVILPALAGIFQVIGIAFWHEKISDVILVSLSCILALFLSLIICLVYNNRQKVWKKEDK